jgi:hypothetical protein
MDNARSDFKWFFEHVTESTQVKTGPGALHTIVLNGLDTKSTITVWDGIGAAGNVIGIITNAFPQPRTLIYDEDFTVGLYIQLTGQGDDLTVNYV